MEQIIEPRNKPEHLQPIIFNKGTKNTQWGKNNLFNKQHWENWIPTCKRMKFDPYLRSHTHTHTNTINSK